MLCHELPSEQAAVEAPSLSVLLSLHGTPFSAVKTGGQLS